MSYKTGVMTCRLSIDGIPLGEKLSTLSTEDFEQIKDNNNDNLNATTKCFLKAISTSCRAMGHTEQAAKDARRHCFAMLDYFGLNSLFLSTTPDNECSFRVSKMEYVVLTFDQHFPKWNILFCITSLLGYSNMNLVFFSMDYQT